MSKVVVRKAAAVLHGLTINIEYKLVKNITLRIKSDGSIHASVPYGMPKRVLDEFLQAKEAWLQSKLTQMRARTQEASRYVMGDLPFDGTHIWLWGERLACFFVHSPHAQPKAERREDGIYFSSPKKLDAALQAAFAEAYYKYLVTYEGMQLLNAWQGKIGVRYTGLKVHRMKTRWGSCNVRTGSINLNTLLACWPKECLEYIVVHELTHLLEANHSPRFHALVTKFLPEWKQRKRVLEQFKPV